MKPPLPAPWPTRQGLSSLTLFTTATDSFQNAGPQLKPWMNQWPIMPFCPALRWPNGPDKMSKWSYAVKAETSFLPVMAGIGPDCAPLQQNSRTGPDPP